MTPERWRRITELAFAARQREAAGRGAFLDRACASDASLRAEVDALLAADGKGSEPSDALTVSRFEVAPLEVGAWLGPYRIEALLGTGGMGEVYRARDPRLGRDVALKVLPVQLAADPARRERLLKEARAAAALNHPNICTVHEIGEAEGRDYLVFELIEGRTLSALRRTGGLSLTELLDLFVPLSEALEFAHRRGIVHRDLKPSNMMVSSLGLPKILDFGLAKDLGPMSERAGSTRSTGTGPGVVLGTAGYMSPEQALGHPTDARTDVFAFGCVLYEMAGGRRAFEGDSFVEVTYAVLHEAPKPLAQLRPDLPPVLTDVVSKSLLKSSEERCRSMSEVTDALRAIRTGRSSLATRTAVLLRRPTRAWRRGLTAILVAGALLGGVVWTRRLPNGNDPLPRLANPAQVTVAASLEDYPTWSPDGRTLAYESNQSGGWDIWVTNAAGGQAVDRTADYAGDDRYPSWSPDGRQIAFWSDRGGGGYQLMPAIGGAAQHLASTQAGLGYHFYSPPQWSADGTELAYVMYEPVGTRFDSFVEILSLATREAKRLPLPGAMENRLDLSWSPDGRHMAYVDAGSQLGETTQLRVLSLSDGKSVEVTDDRANVRGPFWSVDGRYLYFIANNVGAADLWRQRMTEGGTPAGAPQRVTTAAEVRHAALSADGAKLAFSKGRWVANVWRIPLLEGRPATWSEAEQVTFEQAYIEFVDVSRDGRRLLFSSDRSGNQDLWTIRIGGEMTRLTSDPAPEWGPRWSPDERDIAFYSSRSGDREIWVMPAAGGAARRLTHAPGLDATPSWSPDGRTLAFRSERSGNSEIFVMSREGDEQRQVTREPSGDYGPAFSPDGRWLSFSSARAGSLQLWRMPAHGGTAERLTETRTVSAVWSPDGRELYFVPLEGPPRLWALSLEDRRERLVADLAGRSGALGIQAPATDGKSVYVSWRSDVGDIWIMDVARD